MSLIDEGYIKARGIRSSYDAEKYKDVIYFAIDTKEVLLNGEPYGNVPLSDIEIFDEGYIEPKNGDNINLAISSLATGIRLSKKDLQNNIDIVQGEYEQHLKDAAEALENKVSWELGKTTIVLPNHGLIVGQPNEEELSGKAEANGNASLLMLSKWNVIDLGSIKYPINLNGTNDRPTYNDSNELALLKDVIQVKDNLDDILNWHEGD